MVMFTKLLKIFLGILATFIAFAGFMTISTLLMIFVMDYVPEQYWKYVQYALAVVFGTSLIYTLSVLVWEGGEITYRRLFGRKKK